MKIKIIHDTLYEFGKKVFLEPHYIRLMPKSNAYRTLSNFELEIDPKPAGNRQLSDEESNTIHFAWFDGMVDSLKIRTESLIELAPYNAFDFLIFPYSFQNLPLEYTAQQKSQLYATLQHEPIGDSLVLFGEEIVDKAKNETLPFLMALTEKIHSEFDVIYREEGKPMNPEETLKLKKGSCRDLSWMQINLLRSMGIAARFVSGYFYFESESFELHAWVEVFIPGAGWIGFDPSHGIATGNTHMPIVAAANYENTMPVTGTFRGNASSKLTTEVFMQKIK